MGNLAIITGHEVLECRLVVLGCLCPRLKLRSMSLLLHGIPLNTIGCFHNGMRRIGFLEISAVVPEGIPTVGRAGFDHTVADSPKHRAFLRTGECCSNQRSFSITAKLISTMAVNSAVVSIFCSIGTETVTILICISSTHESSAKVGHMGIGFRNFMTFYTIFRDNSALHCSRNMGETIGIANKCRSFVDHSILRNESCTKLRCFSLRQRCTTFRLDKTRNRRQIRSHGDIAIDHLTIFIARYKRSPKLSRSICSIRDISTTGLSRHLGHSASERNDILSAFSGNKILCKLIAFHTCSGNCRFALDHFNRMGNVIGIVDNTSNTRSNSRAANKRSAKFRNFIYPITGSFRHSRYISVVDDTRLNCSHTIFLTSHNTRHLISRNSRNGTRNSLFVSEMDTIVHSCGSFRKDTGHFRCTGNSTGMFRDILMADISGYLFAWECTHILRNTFCSGNKIRGRTHIRVSNLTCGIFNTINITCSTGCVILHTGTMGLISIHASKDGSIIESTTAFAAGHLIPLTAIRCGNNTVRSIRLLKLR